MNHLGNQLEKVQDSSSFTRNVSTASELYRHQEELRVTTSWWKSSKITIFARSWREKLTYFRNCRKITLHMFQSIRKVKLRKTQKLWKVLFRSLLWVTQLQTSALFGCHNSKMVSSFQRNQGLMNKWTRLSPTKSLMKNQGLVALRVSNKGFWKINLVIMQLQNKIAQLNPREPVL